MSDKKVCPDCGLEKIPAAATECPDCGYKFEEAEEAIELPEEEEEITEEKPVVNIGILSVVETDESGEKTFKEICRLQPGETKTFGRASKKKQPDVDLAQFVADAGGISGMHFSIGDGQLTDLGSTNGTYIIHHLTPGQLALEVKEDLIDNKFPDGWREEPPIQLQILVGIPLKSNETYVLDNPTEFRADVTTFLYTEEEEGE